MNEFKIELLMKELGLNDINSLPEDKQADILCEKFLMFSKKSAENILLTCWVVNEATERFKDNYLTEVFYKKIGIDAVKDNSQIKKYRVIGKEFAKLMKFVDVLPHRWSTIYRLARESEHKLIELRDSGVLNREATVRDLFPKNERIIPIHSPQSPRVEIQFKCKSNISPEDWNTILGVLAEWQKNDLITLTSNIVPIEYSKNDEPLVSEPDLNIIGTDEPFSEFAFKMAA